MKMCGENVEGVMQETAKTVWKSANELPEQVMDKGGGSAIGLDNSSTFLCRVVYVRPIVLAGSHYIEY